MELTYSSKLNERLFASRMNLDLLKKDVGTSTTQGIEIRTQQCLLLACKYVDNAATPLSNIAMFNMETESLFDESATGQGNDRRPTLTFLSSFFLTSTDDVIL